MLWWDWDTRQRLTLLTAMFALAAIPCVLLGWLPNDWRAFVGGTAFLAIAQIVAWMLFVGLRTGRMPVRGGAADRSDSPTWFWIVAAMYAALLLAFFWAILVVLFEVPMPTF